MRHIKFGEMTPQQCSVFYNFDKYFEVTEPTLITATPSETFIAVIGGLPEEYLNLEGTKIKVVRNDNLNADRAVLLAEKTLTLYLFLPDKFKKADKTAIRQALSKTFTDKNIGLTMEGNDSFFYKDGKDKKFSGWVITNNAVKGMVTYEFPGALANKIYDFNNKKFTKKGEITDITDIVGGLEEVNVNFTDNDSIVDSMATALSVHFKSPIYLDSFSEADVTLINQTANQLDTYEWNLEGQE